jgi:valyl-tRNA synthetase
MARVSDVQIVEALADSAHKRSTFNFDVTVIYEKQLDIPAERERLTKDLAKFEKEMESKQKQLQNDGFLAKAPVKVVDGLRARADELDALIEKARTALKSLETLERT